MESIEHAATFVFNNVPVQIKYCHYRFPDCNVAVVKFEDILLTEKYGNRVAFMKSGAEPFATYMAAGFDNDNFIEQLLPAFNTLLDENHNTSIRPI